MQKDLYLEKHSYFKWAMKTTISLDFIAPAEENANRRVRIFNRTFPVFFYFMDLFESIRLKWPIFYLT
ncbi:hypothetical protein DI137_10680 [Legionella pneumophila]|nr:hypothetical protein DI137_10680 [Legionella pneumophila]